MQKKLTSTKRIQIGIANRIAILLFQLGKFLLEADGASKHHIEINLDKHHAKKTISLVVYTISIIQKYNAWQTITYQTNQSSSLIRILLDNIGNILGHSLVVGTQKPALQRRGGARRVAWLGSWR